jgi:hypothetical protein
MSFHCSGTRRRPSSAVIARLEEGFQAYLRIVIARSRNGCTVFQVDERAFAGGKQQARRMAEDGKDQDRGVDLETVALGPWTVDCRP